MVERRVFEARLEQELARVNKRILDLKSDPRPEELASGGDNTPLSDEVDTAVAAQEVELHDRVLDGLMQRAQALEQALQRVSDGTYGVCLGCRTEIPESRLGVLPEASLCAKCQAEQEEGDNRSKRSATRVSSDSRL